VKAKSSIRNWVMLSCFDFHFVHFSKFRIFHDVLYRLALTFTYGEKTYQIVGRGGVFAPLENIEIFKQVKVDPEI